MKIDRLIGIITTLQQKKHPYRHNTEGGGNFNYGRLLPYTIFLPIRSLRLSLQVSKVDVKKPFAFEDELKEKTKRLNCPQH